MRFAMVSGFGGKGVAMSSGHRWLAKIKASEEGGHTTCNHVIGICRAAMVFLHEFTTEKGSPSAKVRSVQA